MRNVVLEGNSDLKFWENCWSDFSSFIMRKQLCWTTFLSGWAPELNLMWINVVLEENSDFKIWEILLEWF